jgi:hypothetical protein
LGASKQQRRLGLPQVGRLSLRKPGEEHDDAPGQVDPPPRRRLALEEVFHTEDIELVVDDAEQGFGASQTALAASAGSEWLRDMS